MLQTSSAFLTSLSVFFLLVAALSRFRIDIHTQTSLVWFRLLPSFVLGGSLGNSPTVVLCLVFIVFRGRGLCRSCRTKGAFGCGRFHASYSFFFAPAVLNYIHIKTEIRRLVPSLLTAQYTFTG